MTYTHLTPNELVIIEAYFHQDTAVAFVVKQLKRGRQAIYNLYHFLKQEKNVLEYLEQYKKNRKRCGRLSIVLPVEEKENINAMADKGWTPDVIIGRADQPISCSVSTLYRRLT